MRKEEISRKTRETEITVKLDLDGSGTAQVDTGIGFFDHMLTAFAFHAGFDLAICCRGDLEVDCHHTVEDVGIVLGKAIDSALGERRGINRYGSFSLPMDETIANTALDISNRPYLHFDIPDFPEGKIGDFDYQMIEEFFRALAVQAGLTLHITAPYGRNMHHIAEAVSKSVGRALRMAVQITGNPDQVVSTKGVL